MRIDSSNQPGDVRTRETEAARGSREARQQLAGGGPKQGDSVHFSRLASAVKELSLRVVSDDTAARSIRLNELRESVRNGTFSPDPNATAEAMLEHPTD